MSKNNYANIRQERITVQPLLSPSGEQLILSTVNSLEQLRNESETKFSVNIKYQ